MSTQSNSDRKKWGILATTLIASVTVIMNATLQNVALPHYIKSFGITTVKAQWVISIFSLCFLITMTVTPYFTKRYGYRKIFAAGLVALTIGSLAGGFALDFQYMLIARIFQGIGGGLITPLCLSLLRENFGLEQQGLAMGLWSFSNMIAPAIGPTIGGLILEHGTWNYLFFSNIPAVIVCAVTIFIFLEGQKEKPKERPVFDWIGFILISVGLISLVLGVEQIQEPSNSYMIYILFAVAILCIGFFIFHSLYGKQPLLNVRIMKNGLFTASLIIVATCAFTMTSISILVPILMQQVLNISPTISGMATLPHAIMLGIFGIVAGKLLDKFNAGSALFPGAIVLISVASFFYFNLGSLPIWAIITFLGAYGIGNGMLSTTAVATALSNVNQTEAREGAAMINIVKQIGKVIIVVVFALIYDSRKLHYISQNISESQAGMGAIQDFFICVAIFLICMLPVIWMITKKHKAYVSSVKAAKAKEKEALLAKEPQIQQ